MESEIRFLLKDKYGLDDLAIQSLFQGDSLKRFLLKRLNFKTSNIKNDLLRLKNGEPLAYVIGWVEFLGNKIYINKEVLIPRVETEFWVDQVINVAELKIKNEEPFKVLDLCCGSGCIGISILKHFSNSFVTFADISDKALDQTEMNLFSCNIPNTRYQILESNLFDSIKEKYDLILTNPPYVSTKNSNPDLKFEPSLALYSGEDGLDLIKKILLQFSKHLKTGGEIYIEISEDQKDKLQRIVSKDFKNFDFIKDQNGLLRILKVLF